MPAASELTAHRPPALLVERPLQAEAGSGGRVAVAAHDGLDALQLCEAAAQSLAVLLGLELRRAAAGAGPATGMLVGLKDIEVRRPAQPGEAVEVEARLAHQLGPARLYQVELRGHQGEILLQGEVKTFQTGGV